LATETRVPHVGLAGSVDLKTAAANFLDSPFTFEAAIRAPETAACGVSIQGLLQG
jgi:hypothetical protein